MESDKIVKAMQEFITDTIKNGNVRVDKYSLEDAVSDYMSRDFCFSDHIDSYDIRERVGAWCDDNAGEIVNDHLDSRYMSEVIESAINDRDFADDVQAAIDNNMDKVIESIDYKRLAREIINALKENSSNGV